MIFSQLWAQTSDITFDAKISIFIFWIKRRFFFFFANFNTKILISKFFVGNTPLRLPVKETFNVTLISSVVLPTHQAKICMYGNLHYVALKLFCWVYFTADTNSVVGRWVFWSGYSNMWSRPLLIAYEPVHKTKKRDLCDRRRLWSAYASARSDQNLRWPHVPSIASRIPRRINENPCHTGWMYRLIWVFVG